MYREEVALLHLAQNVKSSRLESENIVPEADQYLPTCVETGTPPSKSITTDFEHYEWAMVVNHRAPPPEHCWLMTFNVNFHDVKLLQSSRSSPGIQCRYSYDLAGSWPAASQKECDRPPKVIQRGGSIGIRQCCGNNVDWQSRVACKVPTKLRQRLRPRLKCNDLAAGKAGSENQGVDAEIGPGVDYNIVGVNKAS